MVWLIRVSRIGGNEENPQGTLAGDGDECEAGAANQITRYFVAMPIL
jgi:hypothetical protein